MFFAQGVIMKTLLFFFSAAVASAAQLISVDVTTTFQTIDHFGASDCWSMQKIGEWDEAEKTKAADLLFSQTKGIGLSGWRFNLGGGINTRTISHPWRTVQTFYVGPHQYDWTKQANERWFLQAAKVRGVEQFTAFVNSPPGKMNINGLTNCTDGLGSTNLKNGYEAQFALYLVDVLKHFRDEWSIAFDDISPVNEPQWEWNNGSNQEGNRASNSDIIGIVKALYAELQKQGVQTKISIVESGDLKSWYIANTSMQAKYGEKYGGYLRELIGNEEIADKIAPHFCGHSYWSDRLETQLVQDRQRAKKFFNSYLKDGRQYWMSEYCILDGPDGAGGHGRDLSINTALDVARVIHYDLTILNASAWNWWTAVSPEDYKDGLLYTNYKNNPSDHSVIESKTLWAFGNYSRFIRPGAKRIAVTGADDKTSLMASGYISAGKDKIILVVLNVSRESMPITLQFSGFTGTKNLHHLAPFLTSNTPGDDLRPLSPISTEQEFSMPARSIVTFVGDIQNADGINNRRDQKSPAGPLLACYPNPFNGEVAIRLTLPVSEMGRLAIFNLDGRLVSDLGEIGERKIFHWDGRDSHGEPVGSGVYYCRIRTGRAIEVQKIALIR